MRTYIVTFYPPNSPTSMVIKKRAMDLEISGGFITLTNLGDIVFAISERLNPTIELSEEDEN